MAATVPPPTTVVHRHAVRPLLPLLQQLAAVADVVAVDLEFTGLGDLATAGRAAYVCVPC